MQKGILYIIIGIILIVVAVTLLAGSKTNKQKTQTITTDEHSTNDTVQDFSGTIADLISKGESITCTFVDNKDPASQIEGEVFVTKDMVRSNFSLISETEEFTGSTIIKDGFNYVWANTSFGPFSSKIAVDDKSKNNPSPSIGLDEDLDFTCNPWEVDITMFDLPKDINFEDINFQAPGSIPEKSNSPQSEALMSEVSSSLEEVLGDTVSRDEICNSCNSAPAGIAKEQCLQSIAALGC